MTRLEAKFKRMFRADAVRISRFSEKMFLIIGRNRSTREDEKETGCRWYKNGEPMPHFTYLHEQTVASGATEAELLASAREYKRLLGGRDPWRLSDPSRTVFSGLGRA